MPRQPARQAQPLHGTAEVPRRARLMSRGQAAAFLRALATANPAPETELLYQDPFTLLVAVVLSAQTTDVAVNKSPLRCSPRRHRRRWRRWGRRGSGRISAASACGRARRNVAALAAQLVEKHGGQVPRDRAALEALPGVGRKTANVVLNVAFGENTMAVDTHIFRLGNRTGLAPGKTPRAVEDGLVKRCPPELLRDAHHWLILHGRYVCKARAPECWRCVAAAHCNYGTRSRRRADPPPLHPLSLALPPTQA